MSHHENASLEGRRLRVLNREINSSEPIPQQVAHAIDRVAAAVSLMTEEVDADRLQSRYQSVRCELRMRYMLWGRRND